MEIRLCKNFLFFFCRVEVIIARTFYCIDPLRGLEGIGRAGWVDEAQGNWRAAWIEGIGRAGWMEGIGGLGGWRELGRPV